MGTIGQYSSLKHGDATWRETLQTILDHGDDVSPRGMATRELIHHHALKTWIDSAIVTSPGRKLSRKFMAAEALWILGGDDRLEPLTKHVPRMANYSDDGVVLRGAYGPKIVAQLDYAVKALAQDRDSRQSVLTIWERNPAPSKDIPCTVAMAFGIRHGLLNLHVFMRSSDAWLGLPYDMFSFSMVAARVATRYNAIARCNRDYQGMDPRTSPVRLGVLTITAASSHLYLQNEEAARGVLAEPSQEWPASAVLEAMVTDGDWAAIEERLRAVEAGTRADPWGI